jgi:hypothetical protein
MLTVKKTFVTCAALAALVGGAGAPLRNATAGVQQPVTLEMHCSQVSGFFPIDYATARSLVPVEYDVVQIAPGQALLVQPIQDCHRLVLNGSEIDPAPFVHFWIKIAGPEDFVEIAPGAIARRDYFYSIFEQTTPENDVRLPVYQLGFEGWPIDSMMMGDAVPTANGYSVRVGGVVERDLRNGGQIGYQWQEQIFAHPPQAAPAAHSFYHTKNAGKMGQADVRCLIESVASGYMQLTVDPRSEVAVFGTTLTGQSMDLTMQCNATMWQVK